MQLPHILDAAQSYGVAAIGFIMHLTLTQVIGIVLLVARCIVDLPPAYQALKAYWIARKQTKEKANDS